MSTIVLIHGSWHGAWCWYKVAPRLRALGHTVLVPDLPGHGRNHAPPAEVTLERQVDCVAALLDAALAPAVVVAHSRGGLVLSALSEAHPERVATAVYLAAVLLRDGQTVFDTAAHGADSLILPALYRAPDDSWDMLREEAFDSALYHDCPDDDRMLARLLLAPEPLAPSLVPTRTTAARFGRVPRAYIELTDDRAVPIGWQRYMHGQVPCAQVRALDAGHSAYFSKPDALAGHIDALARGAR